MVNPPFAIGQRWQDRGVVWTITAILPAKCGKGFRIRAESDSDDEWTGPASHFHRLLGVTALQEESPT